MNRAPSLFVSHGSPMFALQPGKLGPQLRALGEHLLPGSASSKALRPGGTVVALLVLSPHWSTDQLMLTSAPRPSTIYDFYGFDPALNRLKHPASGDPALAAEIAADLAGHGLAVGLDPERGLDHGAWVPLRYLDPQARLPVLQLSLPRSLDAASALSLGQALAGLRERGVMIIGSGSLTHTLYEFRRPVADPEYAQRFAEWIRDAVLRRDLDALVNYRQRAPQAVRAHPSEEHLLPLLVAVGASSDDEPVRWIEGGITDQVISMDSVGFGI